ncbi:hypothetical protein VC83_07079 [Pseudogymnoascus destructans]|uniref:Uncharacterized protein n=1 Tax=Pseudogymnoascus destructans TaxID=655981 RepID=A0A177A6U1_9PEZI|nr:uncharacterized protein VC83_07079 [Pseudogymnoascus destructans]OAF56853.1 hypothetical protein VC83_07079 [Pseudogymnoascus destructans]
MVSGGGAAVYDVALKRRETLMGSSGPLAIVKNFKDCFYRYSGRESDIRAANIINSIEDEDLDPEQPEKLIFFKPAYLLKTCMIN